ncbi:MAG: DNA-directed DNA polymerase I [Methanobacteriota archaeon]|nr:MAG: DNA-directed DNA polymerase I [Euryarchaeota archaeon]
MGLEKFLDFEEEKPKQERTVKISKKTKMETAPTEENEEDELDLVDTEEEIDEPEVVNLPQDVGSDISDAYLLDSAYDGTTYKARLTFYNQKGRNLYYWIDTGSHLPYLLTDKKPEEVQQIPQIAKSKFFKGTEVVTKHSLLRWKDVTLTRVYGTTPTDIGGSPTSFREFVYPAYEANIRYHFNFLADKQITTATFYDVKDGNLRSSTQHLPERVTKELEEEFRDEIQEEREMLGEYMPILFQPTPEVKRAAFDIEVGSEQGRMPNVQNPIYPVISIALVGTDGRRIFWVLNRHRKGERLEGKGIDIRRFDEERDLLIDFFNVLPQYPLLITFNGDNFDNPYLFNRAKRLRIDDIPITIRRNETGFKESLHFDLHIFFRNAAIRTYAFGAAYEYASLDDISNALLGERKLEHPEVWINDMDLQTLMNYNMQDTELTLKLTTFDNSLVMRLVYILMRITKVPFTDFVRTNVSTWLKYWLIYEHRKRNYLVPLKEEIAAVGGGAGESHAIIEGKKYQGAIVIDPKPGVWWNVQVLDFASLYPSIIKTRNLSYETINCPHQECRSNRVPELSYWVCTKKVGIVSLMIGFVRDVRVKYFKPKKKENPDFKVIEQALKVLINAGYGVLGSAAFDFYCLPVAESTTAYARDAIMKTKKFVEEQLNLQVLYGDTDSVFVYNPSEEQINRLKKWAIDNLKIELGKDYDFRYAIFTDRKKNYLGITKSGKPIVKGLVAKKKNTPNVIREYFDKMLKVLSEVTDEATLQVARNRIKDLLKELVNRIKNNDLSIDDVVIRTTFTRRVKDYETWTQPIQALAQLLEAGIPEAEQIDVGDTIEYVPIQSPVKVKITSKRLAFPIGEVRSATVKPVQLVDPENDLLGKNLVELAKTAFEQIIEPLGISWKKDIEGQKSIDDFF